MPKGSDANPHSIDLRTLRRVQLTAQRLAGPPATDIADVVDSLRRIQLDPTNAVARSHELVIWSRLGDWDREELRRLLEVDRSLFEFDAFIVPTAHWPIIAAGAAQAPIGDTKRARQAREWIRDNSQLRHHILRAIAERGPLPTSAFEDLATRDWQSSGWSNAKNVSRMLELLAKRAEVIRAGRRGTERLWDLPDRWIPSTHAPLALDEALTAAIGHVVRAKGAAPMPPPSPYSAAPWPFGGLPMADVLAARARLIDAGVLVPLTVQGTRGEWFLHRHHVATLEAVRDELPDPRTTLLSPFDAIVSDRDSLERLWDFRFRLEIYVPPAKRQWGYFVLPILDRDALIGRVDPKLDRDAGTLNVNRIFAEANAPLDVSTGARIGKALTDLAAFAGADRVVIDGPVPGRWGTGLRRQAEITMAS